MRGVKIRKVRGTLLDKVMPQHAGGVFEYTNIYCYIGRLFFDGWPKVALLDIE